MKYNDTEELRTYLDGLLADIEAGKLSNGAARVRLSVAKTMLDTVKVEVSAAALGRGFDKVAFGGRRAAKPEAVKAA